MKTIFFGFIFLLSCFAASAQNIDGLTDSYMKVKDALVKSDFKSASAAVSDFKTAINKEASFTHKNDLLSAVEKMNKANSLEKQREAFADVSIIMWKTIKASGKNTQKN